MPHLRRDHLMSDDGPAPWRAGFYCPDCMSRYQTSAQLAGHMESAGHLTETAPTVAELGEPIGTITPDSIERGGRQIADAWRRMNDRPIQTSRSSTVEIRFKATQELVEILTGAGARRRATMRKIRKARDHGA